MSLPYGIVEEPGTVRGMIGIFFTPIVGAVMVSRREPGCECRTSAEGLLEVGDQVGG